MNLILFYANNFVFNDSHWGFDFCDFANFFIHQSGTDWGSVADQSVHRVRIGISNNFIF